MKHLDMTPISAALLVIAGQVTSANAEEKHLVALRMPSRGDAVLSDGDMHRRAAEILLSAFDRLDDSIREIVDELPEDSPLRQRRDPDDTWP